MLTKDAYPTIQTFVCDTLQSQDAIINLTNVGPASVLRTFLILVLRKRKLRCMKSQWTSSVGKHYYIHDAFLRRPNTNETRSVLPVC